MTFALPAFHAACCDPNAISLFLDPQKAFAGDQELKLRELVDAIDPLRTATERECC